MDRGDDWFTNFFIKLTDKEQETLLEEIRIYKDILIEHCPTMLYVAYYLMGKNNAKEK